MQCAFVDDHFLDQAQVLKHLGEGVYGVVKLVQVSSNELYAIKYIKIDDYGITKDAMKEADVLGLLRSVPEVVQLKGICQSLDQLAIIMEPMQTHLGWFILGASLEERLSLFENLFFSLIRAASALRSAGLNHNDIKVDNILVNGDEFKLADFGLSSRAVDYMCPLRPPMAIGYRPPEILFNRRSKVYSQYATNMWAIAVVLVEYVKGELPLFSSESVDQTGQEIHEMSTLVDIPYDEFKRLNKEGDIDGRLIVDLTGLLDPKYIRIITNLLELNPSDRWTPNQILDYLHQPIPTYHFYNPPETRMVDERISKILELMKVLRSTIFSSLMAIELYTRYLGISQGKNHPLGYLAAVRLSYEYNQTIGLSIRKLVSTYQRLYDQVVELDEVKTAEKDLLNKLNFQIYHDDVDEAAYETYRMNIDLQTVPIEEFSKPPIQWFT